MAITIKSFRAAGYKAFPAEAAALELAPITLVIGHNNAGKSSLVRAPVLFADSLGDESQLLSLGTRGLDFARDPAGLFHEPAHGSLAFSFDLLISDAPSDPLGKPLSAQALRLSFELGLISTATTRTHLVVRKVDMEAGDEQSSFPGLPLRVRLPSARGGRHKAELGPSGESVTGTEWDRLLPTPRWLLQELGAIQGGATSLAALLSLKELGRWVHYLGPFRELAQRQYAISGARPTVLSGGAGAVELLAWDSQEGGDVFNRVSEWFQNAPQFGFRLRLDGSSERAGIASLMLAYGSGRAVNLADAGAGIAQVLPLVVRCMEPTISGGDFPTLQIVEQPELHLHPAACAALGDLFINVALGGGPQLLVETHSENLLLRIRRRIAEGMIAPEKVAIYWVENETGTEASFRRLPIGGDGWVEDWPDGVFAEDAEEARALARAMKSRS